MQQLIKFEAWFLNFWFRPASAVPLAWIRIGFGLTALVNLYYLWALRAEFLYPGGMLGLDELKNAVGVYSIFQYLETPTHIDASFVFGLISILAVLLGYKTRLATICCFVWHVSYVAQMVWVCSGWDYLHVVTSFVLMISNCHLHLSLDARRYQDIGSAKVGVYPYRILQLQLALLLVVAAYLKFGSYVWRQGSESGHFFLGAYSLIRTDFFFRAEKLNLFLTHLTLLTEALVPFFLWQRKSRVLGYTCLLGLMLAIAPSKVVIYPMLTLTVSLAFLNEDDLQALREFLKIKGIREKATVIVKECISGLMVYFGKQ